jgi:hypothetical protein
MVKAAAVRTGERSLAPESGRKIRDARYLVGEDRFIVTFDSGKEYSFPRSSLEVDDGSEIVHIQVDRRRFFFRVTQCPATATKFPGIECSTRPNLRTVIFADVRVEQKQPAR